MRTTVVLALLLCMTSRRAESQSASDSLRWRRAIVPRVAAYLGQSFPTGKLAIGRVQDGPAAAWVDSLVHELRWVVASIPRPNDTIPRYGVSVGLPRQLPDSEVDWSPRGRGILRFRLSVGRCTSGGSSASEAEVQLVAIGDSLEAAVIPRGFSD